MIDRDKYTIQQPSTHSKACKYPAAIDIRTPTKTHNQFLPHLKKQRANKMLCMNAPNYHKKMKKIKKKVERGPKTEVRSFVRFFFVFRHFVVTKISKRYRR